MTEDLIDKVSYLHIPNCTQWRIQNFPEVGTPTLLGGGGLPTYFFAKISQKLHEIERIWTRRWVCSMLDLNPTNACMQVFALKWPSLHADRLFYSYFRTS